MKVPDRYLVTVSSDDTLGDIFTLLNEAKLVFSRGFFEVMEIAIAEGVPPFSGPVRCSVVTPRMMGYNESVREEEFYDAMYALGLSHLALQAVLRLCLVLPLGGAPIRFYMHPLPDLSGWDSILVFDPSGEMPGVSTDYSTLDDEKTSMIKPDERVAFRDERPEPA